MLFNIAERVKISSYIFPETIIKIEKEIYENTNYLIFALKD